jgi:hypothetical protein
MKIGMLLCLCLSFAGCNKALRSLQQDPLASQPENVRKGEPPELNIKPLAPKPLAEEALRIDSDDFYSFKEGIKGEISIGGRILQSINGQVAVLGKDFLLSIENIKDFPGASFDPMTGVFVWTPGGDHSQEEYTRNAHLDIVLSTVASPILATRKSINLFVARGEMDPAVLDVADLTSKAVREGESRQFKVIVSDPDGLDLDNRRPRLLVVANTQGPSNVAHLVYVVDSKFSDVNPIQDPTDKSKWIFTVVIDVKDREVTKAAGNFSFSLVAVSRFGRTSTPKRVDARIWTSVREPLISWSDTYDIFAGQENVIAFSVYDPQSEGQVSVNLFRCDLLPGSPSCSCTDQSRDGTQLCTIRWRVPSNASLGEYVIEGEALNQSKIVGDSLFYKKPFRRRVRILADPNATKLTPPPSPTPKPMPPPPAPDLLTEYRELFAMKWGRA